MIFVLAYLITAGLHHILSLYFTVLFILRNNEMSKCMLILFTQRLCITPDFSVYATGEQSVDAWESKVTEKELFIADICL